MFAVSLGKNDVVLCIQFVLLKLTSASIGGIINAWLSGFAHTWYSLSSESISAVKGKDLEKEHLRLEVI